VAEVGRTTARALGELGDLRAAGALMLALQDTSPEVRLEAVGALGKLRSDEATSAIGSLVDAPETSEGTTGFYRARGQPATGIGAAEVRAAAVRALGRIGSEAAVK